MSTQQQQARTQSHTPSQVQCAQAHVLQLIPALVPPAEVFDRATMAGADAALAYLQAKNLEALRLRTQSRSFAQEQMQSYLDRLGLDLSPLSVVHVAGSKGKGSTCAFAETILRKHGLKTGMYTSPHLISLTERYRINTQHISEELFLKHFWRVWDGLWATIPQQQAADTAAATSGAAADSVAAAAAALPRIPPMPAYFAFLTLVGFDLYVAEKVDVLLLEVGLGGKLDATNVVPAPLVTAITPLALEHTEILGNTLAAIAGEKAGIAKRGAPLYTVPQPQEAMSVLMDAAAGVATPLRVALPLGQGLGATTTVPKLGLSGAHQLGNAALGATLAHVALCRLQELGKLPAAAAALFRSNDGTSRDSSTIVASAACADKWQVPGVALVTLDSSASPAAVSSVTTATSAGGARVLFPPTGALDAVTATSVAPLGGTTAGDAGIALPPLFAQGLTESSWAGRCQVVADSVAPNLTVFLDGAHTVESIGLCAEWFSTEVAQRRGKMQQQAQEKAQENEEEGKRVQQQSEASVDECELLFNCGHVRNPFLLLEPLAGALNASATSTDSSSRPIRFARATFTPFEHDRLHLLGPQSLTELAASCGHAALPASTAAALACVDALPAPDVASASATASASAKSYAESGLLSWQRTLMGVWDTVWLATRAPAADCGGEVTVGTLSPSGAPLAALSPAAVTAGAESAAEAVAKAGVSSDNTGVYLRRTLPSVATGSAACYQVNGLPSATVALEQLRVRALAQPEKQFYCLVTGSLYLVGNTLNALKVAV